jgi:hypothetical protein
VALHARRDSGFVATALTIAVLAIVAVPVCMMFSCAMGAMGHDCGLAGPLHCDSLSISQDGLIGTVAAALLFVFVSFALLATAFEAVVGEGLFIPAEVVVSRDPPGDRLNGRLLL